jgi:hypothetical protein
MCVMSVPMDHAWRLCERLPVMTMSSGHACFMLPVQHGNRPAVPPESKQLQLLEQLLWTGRRKPAKRHSPVHRAILTYLLQHVSLEFTSSSILYVQQGEPGPWKPASPTDPMDGLRLTVRTMRLAPGAMVCLSMP